MLKNPRRGILPMNNFYRPIKENHSARRVWVFQDECKDALLPNHMESIQAKAKGHF